MAEQDVLETVRAQEGGMPKEGKRMILWPAEYFFIVTFSGYLRQLGTGKGLSQSAKRAAAQAQQRSGLPREARRDLAKSFRIALRNQEFWFNRYRRRFLMLDRFPHNADRFAVDWSRYQQVRSMYGA